ncbi:MAG: NAD(P)/FAD-dependent oxidoreductase [Deltaproteobacteria bacterium]|nr:NAD(P)/FAD-dependent oxidoreductase [Deltaproteobacteria bacterium]
MKNNSLTYDVLVIGAGPAGSTAARFAAQKGVKVLLLERREIVGLPVRCAEYVPLPIHRYVDLKASGILVQPVRSMQTYIEGESVTEMTAPGVMIHRDRLDQKLADLAVEAGVEIKTGVQAWGITGGRVTARGKYRPVTIYSRIIIGADGPSSQVGRWMGNRPGNNLIAAQIRVPLNRPLDHTRVYFRPYLFGGYGWLFPKGETANLGVGIDPSLKERLPEVLNRFKEERVAEGLIENEILSRGGGLVPVGGLTRVREKNMILAGDAAGTCHPITGAGVGNALVSGEMAGQAAAEAVRRGNFQPLEEYEDDLISYLGGRLSHAVQKRKSMIANWSNRDFLENIHHHWIAFKEYYRDET